VRSDIDRGLQSAQIVHAAGESVRARLHPGTYAVVLAVDGELELRRLHAELTDRGLEHALVIENEGDYAGQATAIGVIPAPRSQLRRLFRKYPLLK
jgi:peptidyl-tRNA hydrolase